MTLSEIETMRFLSFSFCGAGLCHFHLFILSLFFRSCNCSEVHCRAKYWVAGPRKADQFVFCPVPQNIGCQNKVLFYMGEKRKIVSANMSDRVGKTETGSATTRCMGKKTKRFSKLPKHGRENTALHCAHAANDWSWDRGPYPRSRPSYVVGAKKRISRVWQAIETLSTEERTRCARSHTDHLTVIYVTNPCK